MNVECIPPVGFLATQIYVTMGAGDNWFSGTVTRLSPDSLATSCAAHVAVCKSSQLIFAGVKYLMCYDVCMIDYTKLHCSCLLIDLPHKTPLQLSPHHIPK